MCALCVCIVCVCALCVCVCVCVLCVCRRVFFFLIFSCSAKQLTIKKQVTEKTEKEATDVFTADYNIQDPIFTDYNIQDPIITDYNIQDPIFANSTNISDISYE